MAARHGKRYLKLAQSYSKDSFHDVEEAVALVKQLASAKFNESVDIAVVLGIDAKKSDQRVRGSVVLPHGTGKSPTVAVVTSDPDKVREAQEAGADVVGGQDLIERIREGWKDFDYLLATPEMMRTVSQLGRILGPKTPSARAGTATTEIREVVTQLKRGRADFRSDPQGVVHGLIGKVSFDTNQLTENFRAFLEALLKSKPPTARGQFIRRITLSSTMGPSVKVDVQKALAELR